MSTKPLIKRLPSKVLGLVMTSLKVLPGLLFEVQTKVGIFKGLHFDYVPRPDDVFVASYPRSGTTLTQMILYQLTSDGSMDFTHISQKSPFFERCMAFDKDLEQMPSPRIFKTHLEYEKLPKGPKYIYVVRNGKDVVTSYYHFYQSHLGYRNRFERFFFHFLRGTVMYGSWFKHVRGWWVHRDDPDMLFIRYEDLVGDLEGTIRKIADFCGYRIDEARMPHILEACSFASMKKHESKFDHITEILMDRGFTANLFLREGRVGGWKGQLTPEQEAEYEEVFAKQLGESGLTFSVENGRPAREPVYQTLAANPSRDGD